MNKKCITTACVAMMLIVPGPSFSKEKTNELIEFEKLCVFGDSLSDIGNVFAATDQIVPPKERYFSGRFTNGPIWVDFTAMSLGLDISSSHNNDLGCNFSTSFAYGAAGTGLSNLTPDGLFTVRGLTGQVDDFSTSTGSINPNTLYIIWSGANDYLLQGVPGIPTGGPLETVNNITTAITNLHAIGARKFAIFNLPDLGQTPIAAIIEQHQPGTQAALTAATNLHNTLLGSALEGLNSLEDIHLHQLDMYTLFQQISSSPHSFGFKSAITDPGPAINCLIPLTAPQNCDPIGQDRYADDGVMMWDEQHPSSNLHLYITQEMLSTLGKHTQAIIVHALPFRDPRLFNSDEQFLPIAILTTPTFDAKQIDPRTVTLEPLKIRAIPGLARIEDINQDGNMDLTLRFISRKLNISCGDNINLVLTGKKYDGTPVIGSDSLKIMECGD